MNSIVIKADNLSKQYRIGAQGDGYKYKALRDALTDIASAPFRRFMFFLGRKTHDTAKINRTIWALKDVSLEVRRGEVIGIIGRNGAGKSTLLKVFSRITEPTRGRAEIHGRIGSLLEVGTGFHPELTGRENIFLNGAVLGMRKREILKKFDEIVAFAELEKFVDTTVKFYSSGMYMRLAFAVAAHLEPEILLVDEVLAVGDMDFQKKCLGKMDEVSKCGRTILFVSHNMNSIRRLCPRAILLEEGNLVMDGQSEEVISRYLRSGIKKMGERVWGDINRAPGNNIVRLRSVKTLDKNGEIAHQFDVTESFSIEIGFEVLKPGHKLEAGFYFNNGAGELIFAAGDFQSNHWRNESRPVGFHRSICQIPANLLNQGVINIQAHIVTNPHVLHAREIDALSIQIVDNFREGGARGNYSEDWPHAAVRPLLKWNFTFNTADRR